MPVAGADRDHRALPWIFARGKALAIAAILLAGSGVLLGAARFARRGPNLPTIEVRRGEFLDSLQFRGEMKAMKSLTISAPSEAGDLQIVKLASEGTVVKSGDLVVQFDGTKLQQQLAQFRSALKSAEAEVGQAKAQARLAEEEDKTAVLKARYDVEGARLEASKQEIVSKIEGAEAKLKLADSEQKLHEAEQKQNSDQKLHAATVEDKQHSSLKAKYDVEKSERRARSDDSTVSFRRHYHPAAALDGVGHEHIPVGRSGLAGSGDCRVAGCQYAASNRACG